MIEHMHHSKQPHDSSKPLISVLLPVYNGEDYLEEAIQSVLDQTDADFELIIINDGSRDGSAAVIDKFNDARIRTFHQENQGLAATLNRAISLAGTGFRNCFT